MCHNEIDNDMLVTSLIILREKAREEFDIIIQKMDKKFN
jgi:hypothetical protein